MGGARGCHLSPIQGVDPILSWIHWRRSSLEGKSTETMMEHRANAPLKPREKGRENSPFRGLDHRDGDQTLGHDTRVSLKHKKIPQCPGLTSFLTCHPIPVGAAMSLVSHSRAGTEAPFFPLFSTSRKNKNLGKLPLVIPEPFALIPFQERAPGAAHSVHVVRKVGKNMEKGIPVPASTAHTATEIPPGLSSPGFVSNPHSAAFGNTNTSPKPAMALCLPFSRFQR